MQLLLDLASQLEILLLLSTSLFKYLLIFAKLVTLNFHLLDHSENVDDLLLRLERLACLGTYLNEQLSYSVCIQLLFECIPENEDVVPLLFICKRFLSQSFNYVVALLHDLLQSLLQLEDFLVLVLTHSMVLRHILWNHSNSKVWRSWRRRNVDWALLD